MCPTFQQTAKIDVSQGTNDVSQLSVMCAGHAGHCKKKALDMMMFWWGLIGLDTESESICLDRLGLGALEGFDGCCAWLRSPATFPVQNWSQMELVSDLWSVIDRKRNAILNRHNRCGLHASMSLVPVLSISDWQVARGWLHGSLTRKSWAQMG